MKTKNEDAVPVNSVSAGNIAGIDNNPPVRKKKKLRAIIRRGGPC